MTGSEHAAIPGAISIFTIENLLYLNIRFILREFLHGKAANAVAVTQRSITRNKEIHDGVDNV